MQKMNVVVKGFHHERHEIIEAYENLLSKEQKEQIRNSEDEFLIVIGRKSVAVFFKGEGDTIKDEDAANAELEKFKKEEGI